jgi:hypothetical protein
MRRLFNNWLAKSVVKHLVVASLLCRRPMNKRLLAVDNRFSSLPSLLRPRKRGDQSDRARPRTRT